MAEYTLEEQAHIALVQDFFEAQNNGSILGSADNFFADDSRYIFIRGGEERLGRGDETGPESLLTTTATDYSDSVGGLPLTTLNFLTSDPVNGIFDISDVTVVPRVGGFTSETNQLDTNAYNELSFAHERHDLIPFSDNFVGPEGVVDFYEDFFNNFEIVQFITTTEEFQEERDRPSPLPYGIIANDDNLAVYGELEFRNKFTGNTAKSLFRIDIEFEDGPEGKIKTYHFWTDTHTLAASMRVGGSWRGQYGLSVDPLIPTGPNVEDFRFPTVSELDPNKYVDNPLFGRHYDPTGYLVDEDGNGLNNNPFQVGQVEERLFLPLYVQWGTGADDNLSGFADTSQYYDPEYPNDQLYGLQGNDTLIGLIGDDELYGGSGNDSLDGGVGQDRIYGHTGINTLTGGADADIFVLENLFDLTSETTTSTITDFSIAEGDKIGLGGTFTLDQFTIVDGVNGAEINLTDSDLPTLAIVENISAAELTADQFTEIRPDYQIGFTEPDDVIGDADDNRSLVLGFFQSFFTGDVFRYIRDNFTEDARYVVIQGENNNYTSDDAFSGERYRITPTTKEWSGFEGSQGFIFNLFQVVDILGTRWPDQPPVTNFYIEKFVTDSADPDNIAIFGRFLYRNNSTANITDGPLAYKIQIKHVQDEETGELVPKIDLISFFEDFYIFGYASRMGGSWTRNYNGELTNIFWGTNAGETFDGSDIDDIIYGYQQDDVLSGGIGNDTIYGGEGDDEITGGVGNNQIWGNPGSDTFVLTTGEGTDTINDFTAGEDKISLLDDLSFEQLTLTETAGDLEVKVTNTDEVLAILKGVESLSSSDVIAEPEDIVTGTPEDDDLLAPIDLDGQRDIVFTGAGNDSIDVSVSTVGLNRLFGGSGADQFYLSTGDRAFGGTGIDEFFALDGTGGNRMSGGAGDDIFHLGSGDRAVGGTGNDTFNVIEGGDNILAGGAGADNFWVASAQIPDAANTIVDFELGTDVIGIRGYVQNDITFGTDGSGNAVLGVLGTDVAIFQGITQAQLETATLAFG
ncbi:MAG: calcium-binding protein [Sphaerospermopsis sp. SIO1G1]|nr:calcium-binding protein [Sphaerospermopsis sp. SIO1G1]